MSHLLNAILVVMSFLHPQPHDEAVCDYQSERFVTRIAGATQITIRKFNLLNTDVKSAVVQFDQNELSFNLFGDSRIGAKFYEPVEVVLVPLALPNPDHKNRRIYTLEVGSEQQKALGKNTLRVVVPVEFATKQLGLRLLVVDPTNKVLNTLLLRPVPVK